MARKKEKTKEELLAENAELRFHLDEAEETLRAIRQGEVDALVVSGPGGDQIYSLQGVEHTYRVLVESMNEGALTLTEHCDIIYCNRAFAAMAGVTCGKMVGVPFRELVSATDKEKFDILWKNALQGNATGEIDLKLNGSSLPVSLSLGTRVQDEIVTVFAVTTDISERKKAEDALRKAHDELEIKVRERTAELRKSEERFRSYFNLGLIGVAITSPTKGFLEVNDQFCKILGYDRSELMQLTWSELTHPDDLPGDIANYNRVLAGEIDGYEIEKRFIRKDGKTIDAAVSAKCLRRSDGSVDYFVALLQDITDRKRTEEEVQMLLNTIQQEKTKLSSLINNIADEVWFADTKGRFTIANPAALREFGISSGDIIEVEKLAKNVEVLRPDGSPRPIEESPPLRALSGEVIRNQEEIVRTPATGELRHREVSATPVRDHKGEIIGSVTIVRDITDRKKSEEQIRVLNKQLNQHVAKIETANKELEAFSYSVSHDLRAPLRHMSGFTEMLTERLKAHPDEKASSYAGSIYAASKKMGLLIDDLLSLSQVSRSEMRKRKVNLNTLVKRVVREIGEELKERKIRWEIDELPEVSGDKSLLERVIVNLISNAVKFTSTRAQAEIRIACKDEGDDIVCYVADNGVGFDMKYVDKIFGVFQRLHTQDEFEGTGIGLSIVQRIISRHGGRAWADSVLGQGATFYFSLPKV